METKWNIVAASVAGKGHHYHGVTCQDANNWAMLSDFWGVALTSDGAGSYANSHFGSAFVVKNIIEVFRNEIIDKNWFKDHDLPTNEEWREIALKVLKQTRNNLEKYTNELGLEFQSTGCTITLVLFSNKGLLIAHIGDGRACYQNENNEWKAMLTPFKGDEVGSTVFITTEWCWENLDRCIETLIIDDKVRAFAMLTDGMESASFLCYTKDEAGLYSDPNEPFQPFFNSNITAISEMILHGESVEKINQLWSDYLSSGKNLSEEYDDKTMLIGILKD